MPADAPADPPPRSGVVPLDYAAPTPRPPAPGRGVSRGASLGLGAAVFVAIVAVGAGNFAIDVLLQGAGDAIVLGVWLAAGAGYGTGALRWSPLPVSGRRVREGARAGLAPSASSDAPPPSLTLLLPRSTGRGDQSGLSFVTAIAIGLGLINLLVLATGLAGVLYRPVAWGLLAVGVLLNVPALRRTSSASIGLWLRTRTPGAAVSWAFAVPLALGFLAASVAPGFLWKPLDPHPYDVLSYHLQIPREWYDAGRIEPLTHNSFSFFPMGMETHWLLGMHLLGGPWVAMYLCQFMSLAHAALTVVAVVCVCRQWGVGPVVSRLAGLMTAAVPWVLMLGGVAYVECGVMLYTLLASAWAMRAADVVGTENENTPATGPMLAAGVCAGLACGMKYTAVAMTAVPLLVLWPLVAWRRGAVGRTVRPWAAGVLACGLAFSPWLVRNAVWTGNPVFPLATGVFGRGHFTADQVDRYRTAHAPPLAERPLQARLHAAMARVFTDGQFGTVLWPAAGLAVVVLVVRRMRATTLFVLLFVAMTGVWLGATHVMPRFITPAVPLAAVLVAVATTRVGRSGPWIGAAVMTLHIIIGLLWTWRVFETGRLMGQQGLFRLSDLSILETPDTNAARTSGDRIALIGDAQAFYYVVPSDRLLYRGIFDVTIPPGTNVVDGWLGRSVEELRRDGFWVVVNTSELDRLTRTYAHLPRPTPPWDRVSPTPTVLPPIR